MMRPFLEPGKAILYMVNEGYTVSKDEEYADLVNVGFIANGPTKNYHLVRICTHYEWIEHPE
jgi:hypothetical protein